MKRSVFYLFIVLLLLVSSCTSKKKLVSPMAHVSHFEWMTAKFNGELTTENGNTVLNSQLSSFNFTGALRIRRDSAVWLSAAAFLGVESVRVLVTNDSVFMINRINQTYLTETLEETCRSMSISPMSLPELQTLLLGNGAADHVEIPWGPYTAKIKYNDIHWDEPTSFPMKVNKKYEKIKLKP